MLYIDVMDIGKTKDFLKKALHNTERTNRSEANKKLVDVLCACACECESKKDSICGYTR